MEAEIIEIQECQPLTGPGIYPHLLTPYFDRMRRLGRHGEIVRVCLTVLDLYPEDLKTRATLVEAYLEMGFSNLADQELRRIRGIAKVLEGTLKAFETRLEHKGGTVPEEKEPKDEDDETGLPDMATLTLAELYLSQGKKEQAIAIYRKILEEDPLNAAAADRLAALGTVNAEDKAEDHGTDCLYLIEVLEKWLERLRGKTIAS